MSQWILITGSQLGIGNVALDHILSFMLFLRCISLRYSEE